MTIRRYTNKWNGNKHIEVVRYACGHYHMVQYMQWGDVVNKLGSRSGRRFRVSKRTLESILEDYEEV